MKQGGLIKSSLGRKLLMSLSGLFLISFLIVHLAGNLQLLKSDGGAAFNAYSEFMGHNPLIQTIAKILYLLIIVHVVDGLMLAYANKNARPIEYSAAKPAATWASRNMALLGVVILFFLIVHLANFWFVTKFGSIPKDEFGNMDLYQVVLEAFSNPIYVGIYLIGLVALAFHLLHGFQSAFQTLGLNHSKYTPVIKAVGLFFGLVLPVGFAIIPLVFFVQSLN